jgi:3-methyladenine DNA glycosylase AlkD
MNLNKFGDELRKLANPKKAKVLQNFFKTGKGDYGEGDIFLGVVVPEQRKLVKKFYKDLTLQEVQVLLNSEIHEERLVALLVLVEKFEKNSGERKEIFDFYLGNTKKINNWDLVDLSAPKIVGKHLLNLDKAVLYEFANSDNLWKKRIAILSTFTFIRYGKFSDSLKIAEILLNDEHDLIHKAVGWMLREIGKRDLNIEEEFLKKHYKTMPRTMLRYAIEKFEEAKRKSYLNGEV